MTIYKYFDIEYIGYKNKKLALYLVFVQTQFQTQTQKQAKVSLISEKVAVGTCTTTCWEAGKSFTYVPVHVETAAGELLSA